MKRRCRNDVVALALTAMVGAAQFEEAYRL